MTRLARESASRHILRALYSPNQIQEQMAWFWLNHFSVFQFKSNLRVMLGDYEDTAIRPHALGKFHDLLAAVPALRHPNHEIEDTAFTVQAFARQWAAGAPVELDSRRVLQQALSKLGITGFGLNQPGTQVTLKVYVVLTTGNEAGSAAMVVASSNAITPPWPTLAPMAASSSKPNGVSNSSGGTMPASGPPMITPLSRSNSSTAVLCPYFALNFAAASPGRPAWRATMVRPGVSTGTAQHTANAASASFMFRQGITRNSCMYGAPVTIALQPEMTMPSACRSTICR